ncbi:hypothetical protein ACOMHN_039665 [Nucella lapillus]
MTIHSRCYTVSVVLKFEAFHQWLPPVTELDKPTPMSSCTSTSRRPWGNNNNWFSYQRSRRNFGNNSQDARKARNHAKKSPYRGSHPHEYFYHRVPSNPPNEEEEFMSDSSRNNRFRNRWKGSQDGKNFQFREADRNLSVPIVPGIRPYSEVTRNSGPSKAGQSSGHRRIIMVKENSKGSNVSAPTTLKTTKDNFRSAVGEQGLFSQYLSRDTCS